MEKTRLFRTIKKTKKCLDNLDVVNPNPEEELIRWCIIDIIHDLDWKGINILEQFITRDGKIPDIVLLNNNYIKAIVEVKRADKDLEEHKEQLYKYLIQTEAKLGILTNGHQWWFFLPRYKNQWRLKKFCEIEMVDSTSDQLHKCFLKFLSRKNLVSPQYSRIARKCIGKYCMDKSISGISDEELKRKIDELRNFRKLNDKKKVLRGNLRYEASLRGLPVEYCL